MAPPRVARRCGRSPPNMYGLVNLAVQELVTRTHGEAAWLRIKRRAGVDTPSFLRMTQYPDEVTYALVGAASAELGAAADELLRGFGRFWIEFAMQEGYRELFLISGPDLRTFLGNLDNLHARLGMTFVGMDAPSFAVTDQGPDELLVHYYSSRAGLTPFVQGLLEGLGPVFGQRVEATVQATRADGRDHDTFHVRCTPSPERAKGVALPVN
ncbi:MAG: heme NO-binding domain-containing protein [Planctomycetota bacterium]